MCKGVQRYRDPETDGKSTKMHREAIQTDWIPILYLGSLSRSEKGSVRPSQV